MTPLDKFRALAEGLYLSSTDGHLSWHQFENAGSFYAEVAGAKIEIQEDRNGRGEKLIIINIYNREGQKVESFDDELFGRSEPASVNASSYFTVMSNLFDVARRNATGADKLVDDILKSIGAPRIDSDEVPF